MTKESDSDPILLTVEQAAGLLQISRSLCYDLVAEGRLSHVRLGRTIRIPRRGLEDWVGREARLPQTPPEGVSFLQRPSQRH